MSRWHLFVSLQMAPRSHLINLLKITFPRLKKYAGPVLFYTTHLSETRNSFVRDFLIKAQQLLKLQSLITGCVCVLYSALSLATLCFHLVRSPLAKVCRKLLILCLLHMNKICVD